MPRKLLVEEANRIYFFYKVLLLLVIDRSFHNEGGVIRTLLVAPLEDMFKLRRYVF